MTCGGVGILDCRFSIHSASLRTSFILRWNRGAGGLSYVFWCGLFGKGLADGGAGGIINTITGVGSG